MKPQTIATLQKLEQSDWFVNVGNTDHLEEPEKVQVVLNWEEAILHCSSIDWENLCLEAVNQYCCRIAERNPERFASWNKVVDQVKPAARALVQQKISQVCADHDLPKVFKDTVDWDILHLCMEAEFSDVYPPGFYASQAFWYVYGHFPCGWIGTFPEGKLVIY